jgi:outer membrane protein
MRSPLLVGLLLAAASVQAQTTDSAAGPALPLEEALTLARRNNPEYLQTANDRRAAAAAVRSAYGTLLPRLDASFSGQYQEGGDQFFNGVRLSTNSDVVQSQYQVGLTYNLSAANLIQPRLQRASAEAVEADVTGSAAALRASVAQQYLNVLQAEARSVLADTLRRAAATQVALARARAAVGAATQLDVRRAEVEEGQAQVALIKARNDIEIEKLRLFQRMGVPQPANVRLTTTFAVIPPTFTLDSLLGLARGQNPTLLALRSREKVAGLNVRSQQSAYTPSLRVSTGWGGYSQGFWDDDAAVDGMRASRLQSREQCFSQDSLRVGAGLSSIAGQCATIDFTGADAAALRSANDRYPLDFTRAPWSLSATVSVPLFDGFVREQRVQEAQVQRDDARQAIRARELALTADVTAAYLILVAAQQTVAQQELNAQKAREELTLAEERYRVGAATFLDVVQSRSAFERVEADRITAVYDYHKAFAALESAVGRPLR